MLESFVAFWQVHLPVLSILLPAFTAFVLILIGHPGADSSKNSKRLHIRRWVSIISTVAGLLLAIDLVLQANSGQISTYYLGDWAAPFGISLTLDRLSAMMMLLTYVLAVPVLGYACGGWDQQGRFFHVMFHFQLMGICGAFLTGDLFNLFVFFEVLLLASYVLLLHGQGSQRFKIGVHYVVINLVASALFLIGLALIYGNVGSLNMVDVARLMPTLDPDQYALTQTGSMLLLVVFGIKAAMLPLSFWLPNTYAAAAPPVAALFAIMTKVGIYSILRVNATVFGIQPDQPGFDMTDWLLPVALLSSVAGVLGALSASNLRRMTGFMMLASVGTILTGIALFSVEAWSAALFYLPQSTLVVAAFYLLAEWIRTQRETIGDTLNTAWPVYQPVLLGLTSLLLMMMLAGLPPFAGFLGKIMLLQSAAGLPSQFFVFAVVIVCSILGLIALSRAGILLFWHVDTPDDEEEIKRFQQLKNSYQPTAYLPVALFSLIAMLIAIMVFASPIRQYTDATALQLKNSMAYQSAILKHDENHNIVSTRLFDPAYLPYVNQTYNRAVTDNMADETDLIDEEAQLHEEQQIDHALTPQDALNKPSRPPEAKMQPMENTHE
jgi:multicomponent K+:H+ antiporter subunit D